MRTRNYDWFDGINHRPMYGFQIRTEKGWRNVAEDGWPCIYPTTEERDAKRAEYRRKKAVSHSCLRALTPEVRHGE